MKKILGDKIDADTVRRLFVYDPDTGFITNAKSGRRYSSNKPGRYVFVSFNRKPYLAHRVIWTLCHGREPKAEIDHINGDRSDNRLSNLRLCNTQQNRRNARLSTRNTSGVKGVSWQSARRRWLATVIVDKKSYIARFRDIVDAEAWVKAKRAELHGDFANDG